jgi:hypothetical protein
MDGKTVEKPFNDDHCLRVRGDRSMQVERTSDLRKPAGNRYFGSWPTITRPA